MLTAMRFAIHGREVAVPKVVGMTLAQAEQSAINDGLLLSREDRFYSDKVPEGRVISQVPLPGTKVRRGWRVRVSESLGPQRVTIPDVVGQSDRAAELNLSRRGLTVGSVASIAMEQLLPDQVIAQSPPANAQGISAPKVNLLLSAQAPGQTEAAWIMPDLGGLKLADASAAVVAAGFKVGRVRMVTDPLAAPDAPAPPVNPKAPPPKLPPDSVIVHQTPPSGFKVTKETTVSFDVIRPLQP
jgi:beta-lactam-binding protein with PASTA domain